jgi:GNAT superfamily N-acetyltransferase
MDDWRIEPLDGSHDRGGFTCGKAPLDDFLRSLVSQYEKRGLGRTYVAVLGGQKKVYGYYTLATGAIAASHLPPKIAKKLPKHPVPVVLLGKLAVDQAAQGKRLGEFLLMDALRVALGLSEAVGLFAVEVDAIDAQAKRFYEKYGFSPLADNDRHLYLAINTIGQMVGGSARGA